MKEREKGKKWQKNKIFIILLWLISYFISMVDEGVGRAHFLMLLINIYD